MGSIEHLSLKWNSFDSNSRESLSDLYENEELFDVTLITGSRQIKAHKVVLSACSPVFRSIIKSAPPQTHPWIYLKGINVDHLELLISFLYHGEVKVIQEELDDFIAIAKEFEIKCLNTEKMPTSLNDSPTPSPPRDLPDLSIVDNVYDDLLSISPPAAQIEKYYTPYEINDSNITLNIRPDEFEHLETNNEDSKLDKNKKPICALDLEISLYYSKQKTGKKFQCNKYSYSTHYVNSIRNHVESNHISSKGVVCSFYSTKLYTIMSMYNHSYIFNKH
ncbi:protein jim lovell-like [Lepeophtheirus salmonis]|uniref:protein jim lovell-like n=1 Tax=Lepeophtheirus salmonis TaxID=72036 RepID=UPI001AE35434|nr:ring canal kelch homolog [Lepeophtheirus salmonis]